MSLNFDNLYAAFKLLDRDGSVYVGRELLHFVPGEVTRDWYAPYCELLAAFGLNDPRPKDPHLGFYVQHFVPRDIHGGPYTGGLQRDGWPATNKDERLKRFKLSERYKALMENVQKLQWYEAVRQAPYPGDTMSDKLREAEKDPFVKQWRKP